MNTQNVVSVDSRPGDLAADTTDVGGGAAAERLESGRGIVRVSLFGFSIELAENTGVMPFAVLGC
jgi:hypothetical protein